MKTIRDRLVIVGLGAALTLCAGVLPGCRGDRSEKRPRQFFPDMDDSPKWKNQEGTEFFVDGRQMRPPPPHTVAFGRVSFLSDEPWAADFMVQRADLLRQDDAFYLGYTAREKVKAQDGSETERFTYVDRIPIPVTEALLARGAERFSIYCAVCHGYTGDGATGPSAAHPEGYGGMVGRRWSAPLPSWHDPKYSDPREPDGRGTDGFFFVTARNGVPGAQGLPAPDDTPTLRKEKLEQLKMPSYAHALSERDTWAIVAYIRVLQESHRGTPEDVPAELREQLERTRQDLISKAAATPQATPAGAGAQK